MCQVVPRHDFGADRPCEVDTTRCDGALVARCDGAGWGSAVECPGEQRCREGACQDPTARQRAQAESVATLVDELAESSAWHETIDAADVKARERRAILKGDGEAELGL